MRAALGAAAIVLALLAVPSTAADVGPQPAIVFEDQRTSGTIVLVDAAQLPNDGFVGLHDASQATGDGLGPLVGHSVLLGPGLHQGIPVALDEGIQEPQPLIATLYEDANANRALDVADGHGHHHEGEDRTYTAGELIIGDQARVAPYDHAEQTSEPVDPLLAGALAALASLVLWAVRYR